MPNEHFASFFPAICAGLGLFLVGLVNLALVRRSVGIRVVATSAALALAIGAAFTLEVAGAPAVTAKYLAFGLIPCLLLSSNRVVGGFTTVLLSLHRPAIRFGLLTVAGVATALGSIVYFEKADEKAATHVLAELERLDSVSPSVPSALGKATTDHGSVIVLKEAASVRDDIDFDAAQNKILASTQLNNQTMRRGPAGDSSNCHGWVFAGGKFRLSPDDVQLILKENDYEEVLEPQSGDVVIYRQAGAITHSAVVRYVAEGQPVLVEGKWGALGVLLHPADKSIYGSEYTFYRSSRMGHLLVGLGGKVAPTTEIRPAVVTE